ncbi:MAG: helix-turn-helix transcriptional regulator [Actinomycetales bacterium]|nr:helix-turn-helix transcriptional regulator [Actinomycetales bacterium]
MAYLNTTGSQDSLKSQLDRSGFITISRLAEVSGINKGTLSKYFSHKQRPTIDVVGMLCQALQVSPSELFYDLAAIPEGQLVGVAS